MACSITAGISRPACPGETPGIYDTFYLFNRDNVSSFTKSGNLVTNISFSSSDGFYRVIAKKNSVVFREEKQDNDTDATDYTHELDFNLTDLSKEARDFVNDLNGVSLGAIVKTKGDKYILLGYNDGLQMKVNTTSSAADALGEFVTLRETQVGEKTRRFLKTDVTTTDAWLVSNTVAS